MWQDVARIIRDNNNFIVTTHIHPEGDAIGSEIALAAFLEDLGKNVTIVNSSPTPPNNRFMDPDGKIRVYPDDFDPAVLDAADVVMIVDVNNWGHIGPFAGVLRQDNTKRVCIDHHQGADDGFADVVVSDTTAAAAGVLIYELIRYMKGDITPRIADACYAAIITDTGTFRFSNTDGRVFTIAKELVALGVEPFEMHRRVYSRTTGAVRLLAAVLATMGMTKDRRIAWIHATRDMFADTGSTYDDSDGLIDFVRAIDVVELALFFKETDDGRIKVSLRSNGRIDAYEIAKRHGGGGHRMAAGMTIDGPMDRAIKDVTAECERSR